MKTVPQKAMVLAAGFGKRMLPLTEKTPKPLIKVAGKTLLDRGLDSLADAGVAMAIVNVHYLGMQIIEHVKNRASPEIIISDETVELLDSAGGIVKALPGLGKDVFFILNADTFWLDSENPELERLVQSWNDAEMDILLMLADPAHATGHGTSTDFLLGDDGRLVRSRGHSDGLIYAGAALVHPRIFADAKAVPHSLNQYFDRAAAEGRLFGMKMQGHWITVGTPEAIEEAEAAIVRLGGK